MDVVDPNVAAKSETSPVEVQVDPSVADLINDPSAAPEPVQVEPETVVFVAFDDFTGRINQRDYSFVKGVPVKVPREEVNVWLDAKKGYVK